MSRFPLCGYNEGSCEQWRLVKYETRISEAGNCDVIATTNVSNQSKPCSRYTVFVAVLLFFFLLYIPLYYPTSNEATRNKTPTGEVMVEGWTVNKSRWLPDYILPGEDTAILETAQPTRDFPLTLLIIVCSAVRNFRERAAIRSTWGSFPQVSGNGNYSVIFLLGVVSNSTTQELVEAESATHGDIIQESFNDSYNNLTLKSVMLLKQVVQNFKNVRYVLKSDDDMFIHVPNLLNLISHIDNLFVKGLLLGELICNAKPIQDSSSKWYCPRYMYDGPVYPKYLSGTSYLMDRQVAARLYEAALHTPLFHLEDVYITGFCAKKAAIQPRDHGGFSYLTRPADPCLYLTTRYLVSSHRISPSSMKSFWSLIQQQNVTLCLQSSGKRLSRRLKLPLPKCRSK